MPPLSNSRHERFVMALFEGKSIVQAYADAGYVRYRQNAARLLMTNDDVKARLAELQEEAARASEITVQSICAELDAAISVARSKGQANAMVSAAGLRAKLAGLLVDKSQVELSTRDPFDDAESVEDIADRMLGSLTNARWLPISNEDRRHLADLLRSHMAATQTFLDEVNARPLNLKQQPPAFLLIDGRAQAE